MTINLSNKQKAGAVIGIGAGVAIAYKTNRGFWGYVGFIILGSVAGQVIGGMFHAQKNVDSIKDNKKEVKNEIPIEDTPKFRLTPDASVKFPAGTAFLYNGNDNVTQTSIYPSDTIFHMTGKSKSLYGGKIILFETDLINQKDNRNIYVVQGATQRIMN